MIQGKLSDTGPVVDVNLIANANGLGPAEIQDLMWAGKITSRCECGVAKDISRWCLTFWYARRVLRLTVDKNGAVLSEVCIPTYR
jgi:hypothetical protein